MCEACLAWFDSSVARVVRFNPAARNLPHHFSGLLRKQSYFDRHILFARSSFRRCAGRLLLLLDLVRQECFEDGLKMDQNGETATAAEVDAG